jgi:hypothetical protein
VFPEFLTTNDMAVYFSQNNSSYNIIQNSEILYGSYGIYIEGNSSIYEMGTQILNNTIDSFSKGAIRLENQIAPVLTGNKIFADNTYSSANLLGILLSECDSSLLVNNNYITLTSDSSYYGLMLSGCSGGSTASYGNIFNNMISLKASTQQYIPIGLYYYGSYYQRVFNNTVHLYGNNTSSRTFYHQTGSNLILKNNIFSNKAQGFALMALTGNATYANDYNGLFSDGNYFAASGLSSSLFYDNLSAWQSASSGAYNSVLEQPNFVSDIDLHVNNMGFDKAATTQFNLAQDIEFDNRRTDTPDIGADEFVYFSLGNDTFYCSNDTITLKAGPGYDSYLWSDNSTDSNLSVFNAATYFASVFESVTGIYATDSIYVGVKAAPTVNLGIDTAFCSNSNFTLDAGNGYLSYLWNNNQNETNQTFTAYQVGNYYVEVIDSNQCHGYDTISLNHIALPTLSTYYHNYGYTDSSINIESQITSSNIYPLTERGVVYNPSSLNSSPTISDSVNSETGNFSLGYFTRTLKGLPPQTFYTVKSYAIAGGCLGYGNDIFVNTLSVEPSSHASTFSAQTTSTSQIDLSFSPASSITNCDGYMILISQNSVPDSLPSDGYVYTPGSNIGNSKILANIYNTSTTQAYATGLNTNQIYYFHLIPFNWDGDETTTYNYLTSPTIPKDTAITIVPPTVTTNANYSNVSISGVSVNGSITESGGELSTERGMVYMVYTSGDPTILDNKSSESGSFGLGSFSRNLTGLNPQTHYKYRAYASNSAGVGYGNTYDFYTFSNEPSINPAALTATVMSSSQIKLDFSAPSTISNCEGYLILQKSNTAATGRPNDGTAYNLGSIIGDAQMVGIVSNTNSTTTTVSGLSANTTYHFTLVPYNYDGINSETYNYYTDNNRSTSAHTITIPTLSTNAVPNSVTSTIANLGGSITDIGGESPTVRGFVYKEAYGSVPTISDSLVSESGTFGISMYSLSTNALSPETKYSYRAYAQNSAGVGYGQTYSFYTLSNEPASHASGFVATTINTSQIQLDFTPASQITDADGYIILRKTNSAPTSIPVDGENYSVGDVIGDAIVAAIVTRTSDTMTNITNLAISTDYYFTLIPYNWNNINTATYNYLTQATIPVANAKTVIAPVLLTGSSYTNLTDSNITVSASINNTGGENLTSRGFVFNNYAATTLDLNTGFDTTQTGSFAAGNYQINVSGLNAETRYKLTSFGINSADTAYGTPVIDFYTLAAEPANHSTKFVAQTSSLSQITVSFDSAGSIANADGYMILQKAGSLPIAQPSDGIAYASGNSLGDAIIAQIVANTADTMFTIQNLNAGTEYYFTLYPFSWDEMNNETYNYLTSPTIPSASASTIIIPTVTTLTNTSNRDTTSITLYGSIDLTNGENATERGFVYKLNSVSGDPTLSDTKVSESGSFQAISFNLSATSLNPETLYKYRAYATNSAGTGFGNTYTFITMSSEPAAYPSYFYAEAQSTSQIDLHFESAASIYNADGYVVLMRINSIPQASPNDGTQYQVGNQIGASEVIAITNNVDSILSVSSLNAGTNYYFSIIPYNWNGSHTETYNYRTVPTIPVTNIKTVVLPTVYTLQTITNISENSADVEGNIGNTGGENVTNRGFVYKEAYGIDPTMSDSFVQQFGSFISGNFNQALNGLGAQTEYKFRAFATNSAGTSYGQIL